jgi:hypothetical protein
MGTSADANGEYYTKNLRWFQFEKAYGEVAKKHKKGEL